MSASESGHRRGEEPRANERESSAETRPQRAPVLSVLDEQEEFRGLPVVAWDSVDLERLVGKKRPGSHETVRAPERTPGARRPDKNVDDLFENPPVTSFLGLIRDKVVHSKFGRALALVGLLGGGSGAVAAVEEYKAADQRLEQRDAIGREARDAALRSRYAGAREAIRARSDMPKASDMVTMPDGSTMARGDLADAINHQYTEKLRERGVDRLFEQCKTEDGTLDMMMCFDMYGFKAVSSKKSFEALSLTTGFSVDELLLHHKMMEGALTVEVVVDEETGRTERADYHRDGMAIQFSEHRDQFFHDGYAFGSELAFAIIRDLDLAHGLPQQQQAAIDAMTLIMHGEVDFTNGATLIANDIAYLHYQESWESLLGRSGEVGKSVSRLETADAISAAGCDALNALSMERGGSLQDITNEITRARLETRKEFATLVERQVRNLDMTVGRKSD